MKYYSLTPILKKNAHWNLIIGERSNGKTYAVLKMGLINYIEKGEQFALIRRWKEDFTGKRGSVMFDALQINNEVKKLSKGKWEGIVYYASKWYLCTYDEEGKAVREEEPFCIGFALTDMEHDKSTSWPKITMCLFDEFISRNGYIPDEFNLLCNVLSTIIRQRDNIKIFMCGNTVNKFNPYFKEMGLNHAKSMKQGTIDVYNYGDTGLTVAVEYCSPLNKEGKKSDVFFAFDNPSLSMIKTGSWEIDIYPHCPTKYRPKDILFTYFILFEDEILQCEIISTGYELFTFIHKKTTELKEPDKDIIFSLDYDPRPNWYRNITKPTDKITGRIAEFYKKDKIFYDCNETGEILRNYLKCCK